MLDPLVERLLVLQEAEGLSNTAFAEKLGIDVSQWSRIRRGVVPAGGKVIRGALRAYPGLSDTLAKSVQITTLSSAS